MKTRTLLSMITSASLLSMLIVSQPVMARFKCWTNNEGIRECGEKVPPEYAQKGHQEMSKQGVVVERQERAKTQEEIEEELRQAAIKAEEQKVKDAQDKQDRILLDTFVSVSDIEAARDDKLAVIELDITATTKRNEKTQEDLNKRIKSAAAAERSGKAPNEALLKDIELLKQRIDKNAAFIEGKRTEQETVKADAQADIERFKRLKGLN